MHLQLYVLVVPILGGGFILLVVCVCPFQVVPTAGVSVTNVDMTNLAAVQRAIIPGRTKLVIIETPTNPRMQANKRAFRPLGGALLTFETLLSDS